MPNRIIAESIIWDSRANSLSPEAFRLYIKLIVMADDYGIGPAEPIEMANLVRWPHNKLDTLSSKFLEIRGIGLIQQCAHKSKQVYVIKPDSWDKIQWRMISKRTCSRHLGEDAQAADEFRRAAWNPENGSLKKRVEEFRGISSLARASSPPSEEKNTPVLSLEQIQNPESNTPMSAETRIGRIVQSFHQIADETGIEAYRVSELGWTPDLHHQAQTYGYACLEQQAAKFRIWFCDKVKTGEIKPSAKHKPKTRFFNTWMSRVDTKNYTAGDSNDISAAAPAGTFANLVETAA